MTSTFVEALELLKRMQRPPNDSLPIYSPMSSVEYSPPDHGALSPAKSPTYQSPKIKPADWFLGSQQGFHAVSPSTASLTPQSSVESNDKQFSKSSSVLNEDISSNDGSNSDSESPLKQHNISTVRRKRQTKAEIIYPITKLFSPAILEKRKREYFKAKFSYYSCQKLLQTRSQNDVQC